MGLVLGLVIFRCDSMAVPTLYNGPRNSSGLQIRFEICCKRGKGPLGAHGGPKGRRFPFTLGGIFPIRPWPWSLALVLALGLACVAMQASPVWLCRCLLCDHAGLYCGDP